MKEEQREFNRKVAAAAGIPRRTMILGLTTYVAIVLGLVVFGSIWTGHVAVLQSRRNEQHIDCIIAVLYRQDAPKCIGVKEKLIKDQILPAVFPRDTIPVTTSTSTTRP